MPKETADRMRAQFVTTNPMGRTGESAEVAEAMVFLAVRPMPAGH